MALLSTPEPAIGSRAPDFKLKATDGKFYTLDEARSKNGLLVMFICNHCPYVKAVLDKIILSAVELKTRGIGIIGIMSNDTADYPEDSFENMKKLAEVKNFSFPYTIDETQSVAQSYGAVCTPDFFGYNANLELQYRGRIDELLDAMVEVAKTGKTSPIQKPSMGCSIKWKNSQAA